MNLEEAMAMAPKMTDNEVLVAKPPLTWGSEAMFVELTDDYGLPPEFNREASWEPLLGKAEIDDLLAFLKTKAVSKRTMAELIVHYAVMDCAPAWAHDLRDA